LNKIKKNNNFLVCFVFRNHSKIVLTRLRLFEYLGNGDESDEIPDESW